MTTNRKRPSDLAVWDGDLSANLHVHKPGASMKVSLQEIVDAVPVQDVGGGLATGDIVLKPAGSYPDFFECDGSIKSKSMAPDLAELVGSEQIVGYSADSEDRYVAPCGGTLLFAESMGGYKVYLGNAAPYLVLTDAAGNVLFSQDVNKSFTRLIKTKRAIYAANLTSYGEIWVFTGLDTGTPVIPNNYIYKGNGGLPVVDIVTCSENFDLFASITSLTQTCLDLRTLTTVTVKNVTVMSNHSAITFSADNRCFRLCRNDVYGLYEYIVDEPQKTAEYRLIQEVAIGYNTLSSGAECRKVYFGEKKPQYSYDIETGAVELISTPQLTYASGRYFSTAYKNAIWVNGDTSGNGSSFLSFDYGKTWVQAKLMNSKTLYVSFDDDKMFISGDLGAGNSATMRSGNVQENNLIRISEDNFIVPNIRSVEEGYKYYVKK